MEIKKNIQDQKVFITTFNSKRILRQFDIENSTLNELITEIEFKWFHEYEVKHLLALKNLYIDINKFLMMYDRIKNQDTLTYFEEGNKPAYHKSLTCQKLNSSFNNFRFTKEMKERKIENEVREWYKEQKKKYNIEIKKDRDIIISNCKLKFKLNELPEFISYDNSGYEKIINYSLEEIKKILNNAISRTNYYYQSNNEIKEILDKFGSLVYLEDYKIKGIEIIPVHSRYIIEDFVRNYKSKVAYWLGEYYRVAFNKNIEFNGQILETIGFQECSMCDNIKLNSVIIKNNKNNIYSDVITLESFKEANNCKVELKKSKDKSDIAYAILHLEDGTKEIIYASKELRKALDENNIPKSEDLFVGINKNGDEVIFMIHD